MLCAGANAMQTDTLCVWKGKTRKKTRARSPAFVACLPHATRHAHERGESAQRQQMRPKNAREAHVGSAMGMIDGKRRKG